MREGSHPPQARRELRERPAARSWALHAQGGRQGETGLHAGAPPRPLEPARPRVPRDTHECPVAGMKYRQQCTRVSGIRFFLLMLTSSCRYFSYWSLMNFMMGCQLRAGTGQPARRAAPARATPSQSPAHVPEHATVSRDEPPS